jgi:predicted nucleic acid-binding protein
VGRLIELLGIRVYIDANIVIYAVEGFAAHERVIRALLTAMDDGEITAVTSELTLAEVLVKPKRDVDERLVTAYRTFLEPTSALSLIPVDRAVL